jgi:Fe-S cluster assembly iron-binding protein IscA
MENVSEIIINNLKRVFKVKTDKDLSKILSVSNGTLAAWKARDSFNLLYIHKIFPDLSIDALMTYNVEIQSIHDKKDVMLLKDSNVQYVTECHFEQYVLQNVKAYSEFLENKSEYLNEYQSTSDNELKTSLKELLKNKINRVYQEIEGKVTWDMLRLKINKLKVEL